MDNLHPDDLGLFQRFERLAHAAAERFGLPLRAMEPKRRPGADRALGLCYVGEGRISITFRFRGGSGHPKHPWWQRPLLPETILDTVAHELAHLRVPNHNAEHRALEAEILAFMQDTLAEQTLALVRSSREVA